MTNLSNRTILVTGGTNGIGLGIAEAFLQSKGKVIVCGRNREKLSTVQAKYPDITTLARDVGDANQRKGLAEEVISRFPDLDILVNNARIQRYIDLKKGYDELKSGEDEIAINFVSTVELTALFIRPLLKKPSCAIVNVSSGLGSTPMLYTRVYSATKAAIHNYSLVLRLQLKDTSVKIIEIVPPMVDTELNKEGRDATHVKYRGISVSEFLPASYTDLMTMPRSYSTATGIKSSLNPAANRESGCLILHGKPAGPLFNKHKISILSGR